MPRDRTTRATEQIRRGGFSGGVTVTEAAPQASGLTDLAAALGSVVPMAQNAANSFIAGRQQKERDGADQLRKEATGEAEVAQAAMAAMNAQQRSEYIVTDEMQKKLDKNPYLLPMINKFDGQRNAQEIWEGAASEIDILDDEAWAGYLEQNAPDQLDNQAFAAGFNAEMSRVENQRTQQTASRNAAELTRKTEELATAGMIESLSNGMSAEEAMTTLYSDKAFTSLSSKDRTDVQMGAAVALAEAGNIDVLNDLLNTKRGSAPSLGSAYPTKAAQLVGIAQAELNKQASARVDAVWPDAHRLARSGDVTFNQWKQQYGETLAYMSPAQQVQIETTIERAREEAQDKWKKQQFISAQRAREDAYLNQGASLLMFSTEWDGLDQSFDMLDEDGDIRTTKITRGEQIAEAHQRFTQEFPDGLFTDDPDAQGQIVQVLGNFYKNNATLPPNVRADVDQISAIVSSGVIPEGFDPERLEAGMSMIRQMEPSAQNALDGTGQAAAMFNDVAEMRRMGLPIEAAVTATQEKFSRGLAERSNVGRILRDVEGFSPGKVKAASGGKVEVTPSLLDAIVNTDPTAIASFQNMAAGGNSSKGNLKQFISDRVVEINDNAVVVPVVDGRPRPEVITEWLPSYVAGAMPDQFTTVTRKGRVKINKDVNIEVTPRGTYRGDVRIWTNDDPDNEVRISASQLNEYGAILRRNEAAEAQAKALAAREKEIDKTLDATNREPEFESQFGREGAYSGG